MAPPPTCYHLHACGSTESWFGKLKGAHTPLSASQQLPELTAGLEFKKRRRKKQTKGARRESYTTRGTLLCHRVVINLLITI